MNFIGFHQQRAERVYKASLAVFICALMAVTHWGTAVWAMQRPDPVKEHCLAAVETFENMRLGLLDSPAMRLPVKVGVK